MSIVFNVEAYGSEARTSATADFFELVALTGRILTPEGIADFLGDAAVLLRRDRYTLDVTGQEDDESDMEGRPIVVPGDDPAGPAREAARRVLGLLEQRARILGDRYPFSLDNVSFRVLNRRRAASSAYAALLAIATAHAYSVDVGIRVTDAFEDTVARAVRRRIARTSAFGVLRRSHGSFAAALEAVGHDLLLPTTTVGVVLSSAIKDGGADTLSHLDWGDDRKGRWTFVGQVTCARSDAWEGKANEAGRGRWRDLLGDLLAPQAFLAVPHHVEDLMIQRLVQDTQSLVLDRLRLVPHLTKLSTDERRIARGVLAATVEYQ